MWPQAKEWWQPQKLEEAKSRFSLELPERVQPNNIVFRHPAFGTVRGKISVVLSHQDFVICYSSHRK